MYVYIRTHTRTQALYMLHPYLFYFFMSMQTGRSARARHFPHMCPVMNGSIAENKASDKGDGSSVPPPRVPSTICRPLLEERALVEPSFGERKKTKPGLFPTSHMTMYAQPVLHTTPPHTTASSND